MSAWMCGHWAVCCRFCQLVCLQLRLLCELPVYCRRTHLEERQVLNEEVLQVLHDVRHIAI